MFWGKTVVYIDNSNIYRGGKDSGWLPEYEKLMRFLEGLGGQLWDVHFFAIEESSSERTTTSDFFDYLQKGLGFKLHLYTYGLKSIRCTHCGRFSQISIEKGLDIGMATQIMRDFHNDAFDTMILMSANKDFIELMDFVRTSGKKVKLMIWRNTLSQNLNKFTDQWGIEIIYLDNHRHELEKEHRAIKENADLPYEFSNHYNCSDRGTRPSQPNDILNKEAGISQKTDANGNNADANNATQHEQSTDPLNPDENPPQEETSPDTEHYTLYKDTPLSDN